MDSDKTLRRAILSSMYRCFMYDSDGFVTQERFDRLMPILVTQLARPSTEDALVVSAIAQLAVDVSDDVRVDVRFCFVCMGCVAVPS